MTGKWTRKITKKEVIVGIEKGDARARRNREDLQLLGSHEYAHAGDCGKKRDEEGKRQRRNCALNL